MNVRPATAADVPSLVTLGRKSFLDAFGHLYRHEDVTAFLDASRRPEEFAANIANPEVAVTVADDGGALIGYCVTFFGKFFDERPEPHPTNPCVLSQLYCAGNATGRGVGAALIEVAIAAARARGCDAMQLSVYSENFGGQRFYQRYGFAKVADTDFWVGDHRDDEFLYELRL